MNRSGRWLIFFSVFGGISPLWAATNAPITSVVLYPGAATVQRELTVAAGTPNLEVTGLPTEFSLESLRVESSDGIRIGQISFSDAATEAHASPREAALEASIQALKDKEAELDVEVAAAQQVRDFLAHLSASSEGSKSAIAIDLHSLGGIIDTIHRGTADSLTTVRKTALQKRVLDQQIEVSQRDLEALEGSERSVRTIRFPVAAEHAGRIKLLYPVSNAGWTPKYRAVLDSAGGKVSLERQALITQQTGEDWSGVQLKLSTGQPRANASAPEASSWFVNVAQPVLYKSRANARSNEAYVAAAPAPMMAAVAEAPATPTEMQTAFATAFEVGTPVTLPADGSKVTVSLGTQILDAQPRILTVPRVEAAAYIEAEAARPEGVWLPGEVQLMRDGDYVGTLDWQPENSDKFLLSFGRDDRVRVRYVRDKLNNGSGSFVDSRRRREVSDTFTVSSTHSSALPLVVLESSPTSTSDEVKIDKDFSPKPAMENWDDKAGVVAWKTILEPKSTQTFGMHYVVTYPKDKPVNGLP